MRLTTLFLAATIVSASSPAFAAPFSALYVFGDSLSDNGNLSILTGGLAPAAPYSPLSASNGPVAVDYLAASLGLPLAPALAGGTNFAVVGAATGPVAFPAAPGGSADNIAATLGLPLSSTGILNAQVPGFLSVASGVPPAAFNDALFFIWGGPNDLAINFALGLNADPLVPIAAAARIASSIDLLYGAGARHFLVPNMPDIGLTPGASIPAAATAAAMLFNTALDAELASRRLLFADAEITSFDTFGLFQSVAANPALYGFTDVDDPCYQGPLLGFGPGNKVVCTDPSQYLFWDTTHPTTRAHQLLAAGFVEALNEDASVPEPTMLVLAVMGVAGVMSRRRRR